MMLKEPNSVLSNFTLERSHQWQVERVHSDFLFFVIFLFVCLIFGSTKRHVGS